MAGVALAFAAQGASAATMLVSTSRPIVGLAYDGTYLAWDTRPNRCTFGNDDPASRFHIRNLANGAQANIAEPGSSPCARPTLAGPAAIWTDAGEAWDITLYTASLAVPTPTPLQAFGGRGPPLTDLLDTAGDGSLLAYSWVTYDFEDPDSCFSTGVGCDYVVTDYGLDRVVNGNRVAVPGAPLGRRLAASDGRIALQPRPITTPYPQPALQRVEIYNAVSGAVIATCEPSVGTIRAIAFSGPRLAVLTGTSTAKQIQIFDAATGDQVSTHSVNITVAAKLDMSSAGVLYRRGTRLVLLDPETGLRRVHQLRVPPAGFAIEGTRVVWASNLGGHGEIHALAAWNFGLATA